MLSWFWLPGWEFSDAGKLGIEVDDDVVGIKPSNPAHFGSHATTFEDLNDLLGGYDSALAFGECKVAITRNID